MTVIINNLFIVEECFFFSHKIDDIIIHMNLFSPAHYNDDLFHQYNIALPNKISSAVIKRRMEFMAGRYSAKKALKALSIEGVQVDIGYNRSPIFPNSIIGSISHSKNIACCAITQSSNIKGLGVDVEYIIIHNLIKEIRSSIINDNENNLLINSSFTYEKLFTAVFSAKESLFKALYPKIGYYFGFEYPILKHIEFDNNTLIFELTKTLSESYPKGKIIYAKYYFMKNKVFTLSIL